MTASHQAELAIVDGPESGSTIALSPDQAYTIGSGDGDSIRIAGAGIAPGHVVVKALRSGGFGAKGIAGPFQHNGTSVSVARLSDGDRIALGDSILRYATSAPTPAPNPTEPSDRPDLPGFKILEVLGKGGMGTVYRAEQLSLGREVALKVLSEEFTSDPAFVEQFVAEARAAARLHHPNVVQVFDVDHVGDSYFYSMELMHGGSLEERLRAHGQIDVGEATAMIKDAARGLGFAESLGIVHRDIKPDNLMIDRHGHVKLADLGLALTDSQDTTKLLGTPHFMSPEQIQRQPLDHRSDLYSLGCTFYRLVTGRAPFKRASVKEILRAHIKDEAEPAQKLNPSVPAELGAIIARLIEKDPADRFQTADELVASLEAAAAPPSRKGLVAAIVASLVVVAGATVWWALTRPSDTRIIHQPTIVDDAGARAAAERERRELAAKSAYYEVLAGAADGAAKADALEQMALAHPDTEYAEKARTEANDLRAEAARERLAAAETAAEVERVSARLRAAVDDALAERRFATAERELELANETDPVRRDPTVTALRDELRERIAIAAAVRLDELRSAVSDAVNQRDAAMLDSSLRALEGVLVGERAWPERLLGDRAVVERFLADSTVTLDAIRRDRAAAEADTAWDDAAAALLRDDGFVAAIDAFEFERAAQSARQAASALGASPAATHLLALGEAATRAGAFQTAFENAVAAGTAAADSVGVGATITGIASGPESGLTVDTGDATRTLGLAECRARLDALFRVPDRALDDADRSAFLALHVVADRLRSVPRFLAAIDEADDASGTDRALPELGVIPSIVEDRLARCPEDWAAALRLELTHTDRVSRAIHAFAHRRNTAAAKLLDSVLSSDTQTLVVRGLR